MSNSDKKKEIIGAIIHIVKKRFTCVFLNIFLCPILATPIPNIAATFTCTKEVGIPLMSDARSSKLPDIKAIITASNLPKRIISLPVFFNILCPKSDAPIPKQGATIRVASISITIWSLSRMFSSLIVIV